MKHVANVHAAKSQLSKLVAIPRKDHSVTIATHGKPVVNLIPIKPQPVFGLGKEQCPPVP